VATWEGAQEMGADRARESHPLLRGRELTHNLIMEKAVDSQAPRKKTSLSTRLRLLKGLKDQLLT